MLSSDLFLACNYLQNSVGNMLPKKTFEETQLQQNDTLFLSSLFRFVGSQIIARLCFFFSLRSLFCVQ